MAGRTVPAAHLGMGMGTCLCTGISVQRHTTLGCQSCARRVLRKDSKLIRATTASPADSALTPWEAQLGCLHPRGTDSTPAQANSSARSNIDVTPSLGSVRSGKTWTVVKSHAHQQDSLGLQALV